MSPPVISPRMTRRVPAVEYHAILRKVIEAGVIVGNRAPFTLFTMVDGDFIPTQNLNNVRFIAWDNSMDHGVLQVNALGEAILLIPKEET